MKKRFYLLVGLVVLVTLTGCLETFYPIFHEGDVIQNDNLIGKWKRKDKSAKEAGSYIISRISEQRKSELAVGIQKIYQKGYFISFIDPGGDTTNQYFAFLVKIGDGEYFDFYPAEMNSRKNIDWRFKAHYIKFHSSYKCVITDKNHFNLQRFEKSFLDDLISKNQINIRYETLPEDEKIITASTDELQKFILKYNENPGAYGGDISYCERVLDL